MPPEVLAICSMVSRFMLCAFPLHADREAQLDAASRQREVHRVVVGVVGAQRVDVLLVEQVVDLESELRALRPAGEIRELVAGGEIDRGVRVQRYGFAGIPEARTDM